MSFTIYCHRHTASGRAYVGQTTQSMARRWSDHVKDARAGSSLLFHRAIAKYGPEAFSHEILATGIASVEDANAAEREWIQRIGSLKPGGFNLDLGGKCGGHRHHDTRLKMSESAKAYAASPEERRARSERMTKWRASLTPEQRAEFNARVMAARTPEQRSESARKREASRTPEERSASAHKRESTMDHAARREGMRRAWREKTPEQKRAIYDKAWATRRAKAAA